ncbi:hypothetical protein FUSNEC_GEN_165_05450 [Fusobacterium necrophorum subsp. funduliforme]
MIKECAEKCFYEIANSEAGSMERKTPSRILKYKILTWSFLFFQQIRILKLFMSLYFVLK